VLASRFGKFIRVQFGRSHRIVGATITNYLLEKPRIVTQPKAERNYHVFYQLIRGLPDVDRAAVGLRAPPLDDVSSFYYLNQSGCDSLDGVDDEEELVVTCRAMDVVCAHGLGSHALGDNQFLFCVCGRVSVLLLFQVGMKPAEKFAVLRILTGILHLGTLVYGGVVPSNLPWSVQLILWSSIAVWNGNVPWYTQATSLL